MNKVRRNRIRKIIDSISAAADILEELKDEEEEAYENLPDGIRDSEAGEMMEGNVYVLETAIENIRDVESELEELLE